VVTRTRILDISAYYHDGAAALIEEGKIVAAAQEERFTHRKHDARFPRNAVAYCVAFAPRGMASLRHASLSALASAPAAPWW
jgi:carbamoyltransferase